MKFAKRLALIAGLAALAAAPSAAKAQPKLTNAGTWKACSDGTASYGVCGFEFWDSNTGGWSDNYWSSTGSAGPVAMLSSSPIQLSLGVNTLYFYQDYYSNDSFMGLDLLFDNSVTAQIGGWNTTSTNGVNAFNGVSTLFNANGEPLSFTTGGYQVTLTDFRFDALGDDRVGTYEDPNPDHQSDWRGEVTLNVQTTTPEPATVVLFATGLAGVAVIKRRRSK